MEKSDISLEKIQLVLKSSNIEQKVKSSFESARSGIRMEEPCRILTRFAFDLVRNLFQTTPIPSCAESSESPEERFCFDPALDAMNRQFEKCRVASSAAMSSDAASVSH